MAKKYLTQKEKEALFLKRLRILGIVFVVLVVLTVLAGLAAAKIDDAALRLQLQLDYWKDPWDGGKKFDFLSKKNEVWAYYEALMCVEDDAVRAGGNGIAFDTSVGRMLCVDTSVIEDEDMRRAVEKMYEDYTERKGLLFRTGSLENLKEEGLIDKSGDSYTEGCLLQILKNDWDEEQKIFTMHMFFYYGSTNGQGATVMVARKKDQKLLKEELLPEQRKRLSDDGEWISVIESTITS